MGELIIHTPDPDIWVKTCDGMGDLRLARWVEDIRHLLGLGYLTLEVEENKTFFI